MSTEKADYYGSDYHTIPAGKGGMRFTWNVSVEATGSYQVQAWWPYSVDNSSAATYTVRHQSGSSSVVLNQSGVGGEWITLGTYDFAEGVNHSITVTDTGDGDVVADAIRLVYSSL